MKKKVYEHTIDEAINKLRWSLAHSRNRVALGIFAIASVLAIISLIV